MLPRMTGTPLPFHQTKMITLIFIFVSCLMESANHAIGNNVTPLENNEINGGSGGGPEDGKNGDRKTTHSSGELQDGEYSHPANDESSGTSSPPRSPPDGTTPNKNSQSAERKSTRIIFIAVGIVALLIVIILATSIYWRKRNRNQNRIKSVTSPRISNDYSDATKIQQTYDDLVPPENKVLYSVLGAPTERQEESSTNYVKLQFKDSATAKQIPAKQETDYVLITPH